MSVVTFTVQAERYLDAVSVTVVEGGRTYSVTKCGLEDGFRKALQVAALDMATACEEKGA